MGGVLANVSLQRVIEISAIDMIAAEALWLSSYNVKLGIGGNNEVVGGGVLLVAASGGPSVKGKGRRIVATIAGTAGYLTIILPVLAVGAVFGVELIVWFIAIAWSATHRVATRNKIPL